MGTIGLIAGAGDFPLRFAESARRAGHRIVCVAHHEETDRAIEALCDEITWVHLAQLGRMVEAFRRGGAVEAAMAGGITKVRIFGGVRPDLLALKHAHKVTSFNDDGLLRTIASVFEEEGIRIVDPLRYCPDLLGTERAYGKRSLPKAAEEDVAVGLQVARALGRADVGQTVCLKQGSVVAVEAVEGTDACIRRAGELAGEGIVVVKTSKPGQDLRFDVPCIGPTTIDVLAAVKAAALAFEAGRTIVLDAAEVGRRADKAKLAVVGVSLPADGSTAKNAPR